MISEPHAKASPSSASSTAASIQSSTTRFDSTSSWPLADDPRVVRALEGYLADISVGRRPSREELLERHPEIAGALFLCLDGLDFLRSAVKDLSSQGRTDEPKDAFPPATCLGDYRIIREIGRGGMGVVYEAWQISLGRRVALKVLPFASAIDPKQRQRFHVEAQAAAHLHHPHIVPIFAVGEEGGSHFYAMPFIEGKTLAATIQELRRFGGISRGESFLAARLKQRDPELPEPIDAAPTASFAGTNEAAKAPSGSSSGTGSSQKGRAFYRAVARLGIEAAEALEHAHGLGVLHRDIKPANLLIDLQGKLWVADFGLARFRDEPGLTGTGDLLGTLRYMSPEQIEARRGVVDQRADIYALGTTLYEALTLRPAITGRDRSEILQRILNDDPPRPRKVDPAIPRDLETILLKAMAKSPTARYGTAQELAEDLRRFLDDQAILACPPTAIERAVRWVRKKRTMVATAGSIVLLATVITTALVVAEQRKTSAALDKTTLALEAAEKDLAIHKRAMDLILSATHNVTMRAMETVTDFGAGAVREQDKAFFKLAQTFYAGIEERLRDDPSPTRREMLAKAYFGLGLTRWSLGEPESDDAYHRSIQIYESLIEGQPARTELIWHLAASVKYLGIMHASEPSPVEAESDYRRVVELDRSLLDHFPNQPQFFESLLHDMVAWARQLSECGRTDESEKVLLKVLSLRPRYPGALNNLAWLLAFDPAQPPHDPKRAIELAKKAVKEAKEQWALWNTLAMAYLRAGNYPEAISALRTSMSKNNNGKGMPHDWFVMALIHASMNQLEEARSDYSQGLAMMKEMRADADMCAMRDEAAEVLKIRNRPRPKSKPRLRLKSEIAAGNDGSGVGHGKPVPLPIPDIQIEDQPVARPPSTGGPKRVNAS